MGGGKRFLFPQWVWTPYGGWWADPPQWKRNTALAFLAINTAIFFVFRYSEAKMVNI